VPVAFLGLNYATSTSGGKEPYLTRLITNTYNKYANTWAERNNTHTDMIEQAAADRVLFLNEASNAVRHVDLRFPEYVRTLRARKDGTSGYIKREGTLRLQSREEKSFTRTEG
jgi:predicted double-glycine peptidase